MKALIGYSTGAVAYSDFREALRILSQTSCNAIELSALRENELPVLIQSLSDLDLKQYAFISFHAPSSFPKSSENRILDLLDQVFKRGWPIVVHPNVIYDPPSWRQFGSSLFIENMDKRKPVGRTAKELALILNTLPGAQMCFDIGHARQVDPSMSVAAEILVEFGALIREIHVSEVDTNSKHRELTNASQLAFDRVASLLPHHVPIIIESTELGCSRLEQEADFAKETLGIHSYA